MEIKTTEKIKKGLKKLENEEKNFLKNLSYISNINKTLKDMKNINGQFIKSIKFSYQENNKELNYEEFIFNGIPIPKDIEFKEIKSFSFNVSWKVENINLN